MTEPILAGRYRLQGAVGGNADLYYAVDESLGRSVAVKRLPSDRRHWEQDIAKAAGLQDPHLLAIFDVVQEEEASYLITEELEGETLARWLRVQGRIAPDWTMRLMLQLSGAVVQAEKHGLREISIDPHYLLVTPEGYLKVIAYGPLFGGHGYPDEPQQLVHKAGVLMYEMLTGHVYSELAPLQQIAEDLHRALVQARVQHSWLPDRVEHIVHRALGILAVGRYQTMADLNRDIKAVNHALGQQADQMPAHSFTEQGTATVAADAKSQEPSALNRVKDSMKDSVDAVLETAQDSMKKVAQMRNAEFAKNLAKKLAEQSKPKRPLLPLMLTLMLVVLVGGGVWWLTGDEKSMATGGVLGQAKEVKMPNVLNKTEEQALQILTENGFSKEAIQWVYRPSDEAATQDKVYRQSVDPNEQVRVDRMVVLTVNKSGADSPSPDGQAGNGGTDAGGDIEAEAGEVPNLRGLPVADAEQLLIKLGYHYKYLIQAGDTPSGTVYRQDVEPGTKAEAGTRILFYVSQ